MALFESQLISRGSGSIGGLTLSHNRGGQYIRARVTPVNPNTSFQNTVRVRLSQTVNRWANILTQVQRDAWDIYALNVPLPGPFGSPRNVGGLGMYVRTNVPRRQSGLGFVDVAPVLFNLGGFTLISNPTADGATNDFGFDFDNTDEWANETNSAMLVFASRPQNAGINYFTGPYRLAGQILGDDAVPPVSPSSFSAPFNFSATQKIFIRVQVTVRDGRYSTEQRIPVVAA